MTTKPGDNYLNAKVLTATPQKLHLMLIEGAIRFTRSAQERWDDRQQRSEAERMLVRAIDIAGELLAGVRDSDNEVSPQIIQVYQFLLRRVDQIRFHSN